MSRLDDELRMAFRREPAPPGFTENLLERVREGNIQRVSRRRETGWWRLVIGWFEMSNSRLARSAATVLAILVLALLAYKMTPRSRERGKTAVIQTPQEPRNEQGASPAPIPPDDGIVAGDSQPRPIKVVTTGVRHRLPQPSSEAEAAKEQVMLALHIASSTLGDAQRLVREGEE
jgi:hypothetical protein